MRNFSRHLILLYFVFFHLKINFWHVLIVICVSPFVESLFWSLWVELSYKFHAFEDFVFLRHNKFSGKLPSSGNTILVQPVTTYARMDVQKNAPGEF